MVDLSTTLSVEKGCKHPDVHVDQRLEEWGNGFILYVDQVKCKTCGEIMVSPVGKTGKYLAKTKLILIPQSHAATQPQERPKSASDDPCDPAKGCPGTEMLSLTDELGIDSPVGCGCKSAAAMMDRLGVDGCRNRMNELVIHVEANWESWGWKDKFKAVKQSAWKVAGLGVKATDPIRSLLELAVERADQKRKAHHGD